MGLSAGSRRRQRASPRVGTSLPAVSRRCRSSPQSTAPAHLTADLPCNVDHGIIGLMDPAHGPFVHQAWWWRSRASIHEKTKHFEPIRRRLPHVRARAQRQLRPLQIARRLRRAHHHDQIDFQSCPIVVSKPSAAAKNGSASLTTVTPVTAVHLPHRRLRRLEHLLPRAHSSRTIAKFFGNRFVRQDQQTMIEQAARPPPQSRAHADRRRRQARQVVLRAQAKPPNRQGRAPPASARGTALAQLAGLSGKENRRRKPKALAQLRNLVSSKLPGTGQDQRNRTFAPKIFRQILLCQPAVREKMA